MQTKGGFNYKYRNDERTVDKHRLVLRETADHGLVSQELHARPSLKWVGGRVGVGFVHSLVLVCNIHIPVCTVHFCVNTTKGQLYIRGINYYCLRLVYAYKCILMYVYANKYIYKYIRRYGFIVVITGWMIEGVD